MIITQKLLFSVISTTTLLGTLFMTGCKSDPDLPAVVENITTIVVRLTGPGVDQEFTWNDTDGDGVANTIDTITLPASTGNIQCSLLVYDRSATPATDLSEEIKGESTEHLFVYSVLPAGMVTIDNLNLDANNAPFGIESVWKTTQAAVGTVNIRLFHEPSNKNNPADPGGEVDFDVTFPVKIQ